MDFKNKLKMIMKDIYASFGFVMESFFFLFFYYIRISKHEVLFEMLCDVKTKCVHMEKGKKGFKLVRAIRFPY